MNSFKDSITRIIIFIILLFTLFSIIRIGNSLTYITKTVDLINDYCLEE